MINLSSYKEIVTKAVVGKGKKTSRNDYSVQTEHVPDTVLGCWVINHHLVVGDNQYKIY